MREGARAAAASFLLVSAASVLTLFLLPDGVLQRANLATAALVGELLALHPAGVSVQGALVTLGGFRALIVTECTGIYPTLLFGSLVVATPAPWRRKAVGLGFGVPFLWGANAARIAALTVLGWWRPQLFPVAHLYLGQLLMLFLVSWACLSWLRWESGEGTGEGGFAMRCLAWGGVLVPIWLPLHLGYLGRLDSLALRLFSLAGHRFPPPPLRELHPHTFSLVVFAALMLASRGAARTRVALGAAGGALIVLTHLGFRITHLLWTGLGVEWAAAPHAFIHLVNQYLLPVLLWRALLPGRGGTAGKPAAEGGCHEEDPHPRSPGATGADLAGLGP